MTVLEAETGSGKTEAALIHFLRLFQAGAVDGLYFALPTRAAAVQIHRRIRAVISDWMGEAAPPVGAGGAGGTCASTTTKASGCRMSGASAGRMTRAVIAAGPWRTPSAICPAW